MDKLDSHTGGLAALSGKQKNSFHLFRSFLKYPREKIRG